MTDDVANLGAERARRAVTRLRIRCPVPMAEIVQLYTVDGYGKPLEISAAILQAARSDSVGFYEEVVEKDGSKRPDVLIAAVMLYPRDPETAGEDLRELVFAARPEARRHLLGIIHYARLTRAHLAHDPALRIRATVRAGHAPGRRLARLIGLSRAGESGGFERWEWRAEADHECICRRGEVAIHRRRKRRA